jgi:hypothetical protein
LRSAIGLDWPSDRNIPGYLIVNIRLYKLSVIKRERELQKKEKIKKEKQGMDPCFRHSLERFIQFIKKQVK